MSECTLWCVLTRGARTLKVQTAMVRATGSLLWKTACTRLTSLPARSRVGRSVVTRGAAGHGGGEGRGAEEHMGGVNEEEGHEEEEDGGGRGEEGWRVGEEDVGDERGWEEARVPIQWEREIG